jgi:hypothetical protein
MNWVSSTTDLYIVNTIAKQNVEELVRVIRMKEATLAAFGYGCELRTNRLGMHSPLWDK